MLSLLIVLIVHPTFAATTLIERLGCQHLFEKLPPRQDLPNFYVPISVPHDRLLTTPVWRRPSTFERALTMTTEIAAADALTDLPLGILRELERDHRAGETAPRLRREQRGLVSWSEPLGQDRTVDAAISPSAVLNDLLHHIPNSVFMLDRLSVYFYAPDGTPPTWEMMAEARGALLYARQEFASRGLPANVRLEVHTVGPMPENPEMYVNFGIDALGNPRP